MERLPSKPIAFKSIPFTSIPNDAKRCAGAINAWVSWEEYRNGPFADGDFFTYGAVLLKQRAVVRGRGGIEERDFRQGDFLETLIHQRLRGRVAVAFEHGGKKEDGACAVALDRLLAIHRDWKEPRVLKLSGKLGSDVVTIDEEFHAGGEW